MYKLLEVNLSERVVKRPLYILYLFEVTVGKVSKGKQRVKSIVLTPQRTRCETTARGVVPEMRQYVQAYYVIYSRGCIKTVY